MAVPVATIIRHVLVDGLAVYASAEPIKPADATTVLDAINGVFDDWAAETQASYAAVFTVVTTTGANPEVIGPGGTGAWLMPARPVAIDGLGLSLGGGAYDPIFVTDDPTWWAAQLAGAGLGLGGAYYAADEPNGHLYFASPPASGTTLRLMTKTSIGPVLQTDVLTLPQGYQTALELTVAERTARAFHVVVDADLKSDAGKARARIWGNNLRIPSLSAAGQGLPGMGCGRWNYLTGTYETWTQGGGWTQ
jgi:hypothetical protein